MKKLSFSLRSGLLMMAFFCIGGSARAVTETITTPTLIGVSDATHDGNDIIVIGTTVTVNGAHTFHSLALQSGAVINHTVGQAQGVRLTIAQNASIDASSRVKLDGLGNDATVGPGAGANSGGQGGGGGYGGNGGNGDGAGGPSYGSITQPTDLGSGGGSGYYGNAAGAGGGSIRLVVSGTLQIDGLLSANGNNASYYSSGGGSGGSIYITAGTLSGSGAITSNGGGVYSGGGGGAGGRIALYASTTTFPIASVSAAGGSGSQRGGSGTIYTQFGNQNPGSLIVSGGGAVTDVSSLTSVANISVSGGAVAQSGATAVNGSVIVDGGTLALTSRGFSINGNITVINGGVLRPAAIASASSASQTNMELHVTGNCSIDNSSSITAAGYGYDKTSGPGAGTNSGGQGGGGGFGGSGGNGDAAGGPSYGSITQPTDLGSGGGYGYYGSYGGAGGGSIRLVVSGTLQIDGSLSANGNSASYYNSGGGSGGSIYITAGTLAGSGTITSNGGGVYSGGGGGAGGRIAIYTTSNNFPITSVSAAGGSGSQRGGAGTIYTQFGSQNPGSLIVSGGGAVTDLSGINNLASLSVSGGAVAYYAGTVNGPVSINGSTLGLLSGGLFNSNFVVNGNINLTNGGVLRPALSPDSGAVSQPNIWVQISGSISVDDTSSITAAGYGYDKTFGPGAGTNSGGQGGGGGYGGNGGNGDAAGGPSYGSITQPTDLGSGGGYGYYGSQGGAGGGSIRLVVSGTLQIDGLLSANGNSASYYNSGGGSGGSIYITAGTLAGSGAITSNGGGVYSGGGGGAGGRIALYAGTTTFPIASVSATGGNGSQRGGAGTIYTQFGNQNPGSLIVSGGGAVTDLSGLSSLTALSVGGGAVAYFTGTVSSQVVVDSATLGILPNGMTVLGNVSVTNSSVIRPAAFPASSATSQPNALLTVAGNLGVDATSAISATGYGYDRTFGPGAGASSGGQGGGGGYGGIGGDGDSGTGGVAYGSLTNPLDLGSGGGGGYYGNQGGAGGGSIRLVVGGTLQIDGLLSANGNSSSYYNSGGGSGGSLYITAGTLTGSGSITSNGGGVYSGGGGGAGGRIAIYTTSNHFPAGSVFVNGGSGTQNGAVGTIYYGTYSPSAPTTMITGGPAENAVVTTNSVLFTYTGSSQVTPTANLRYQYRLDNGAWQGPTANTSITLSGLSNGPHTFYVAAIDGLGTVDTAPPSRDFVYDTAPAFSLIAAAPQDTQATITWTTDKPSSSQVAYRLAGQTAWNMTLNQTNLTTAHSVVVTGLTPNTNYEYQVISADTYHTSATSAVFTFKTLNDTTPPTTSITGGPTEGATVSTAGTTFGFTGTDNYSTTAHLKFKYKVDGGTYSTPAAQTTATLSGLTDGLHTFTVAAIDEAGNADSNPAVRHFTTDATPPLITNVQTGGVTDSAIGIGWITNKPTTSQVKYRIVGAASFDATTEDTNAAVQHVVSVYNLKPDTTYEFYVISRDSSGRIADTAATPGTFHTLPDTTAPDTAFTISPANGASVKPGSIVFAWTGADDASRTASLTYQYALDGGAWTPATPSSLTTTTLTLTNPAPMQHTFRVRAYDESGNVDPTPAAVTFTVDGTPPNFTALTATNLTFNSATINWTTDKPTSGQIQYDNGSGNFDFHFDYPPYVTNHSLTIGPLGSNTAYRARVLAKDAAGNMTTSSVITFTTAKLHDLSVSRDAISFSDPGPASGDRITMKAKIHNAGDFDETATVIFYDSTPKDGGYEIGRTTVSVPTRAAADAIAVSPSFIVLEGPHKPYVQIVYATPAEDITGNNSAVTDLTVGAPACRFAIGVATPGTFPGDDSLFSATITNTGSKPQILSDVTLTGTSWVNLVSAIPTTPIQPNQTISLTYRMTPPTSQAGGGIGSPVVLPMTLTASCGMTYSQNFTLEVYSAPVASLDITVQDAVSGNPLNGATIALDNTNKQYFTGPNGKPIDNSGNPVAIYVPSGSRNVYAIASQYLPGTVNTSGSGPVVLKLQPGQALQVSAVTVTPLTPQQIADRGVNLADPTNYGVFDFTLSLKIGPLPVPNVVLPTTPVAPGTTVTQTFDIPAGFGGGGSGGSGGGGGGGGYGGGVGTLTVYYPTPDPTIHTDTWIIIPGEIRFLKQFFDATVFVKNNSSYPINNVQAALTLPAGLSFPDLFGSPQQTAQSLGTIDANSQKQGSWVLRGDLAGTYKVTGSATGTIALGGGGVNLNSSLQSGEFVVADPKISVRFGTPSVVYAGQPFNITINITNQSIIDLNGVDVRIKAEKLVNCHLASGQANPLVVGTIPAGATQAVTFTFISEATGSVDEVDSYVSPSSIEPPVSVTPRPILAPLAAADALNTVVNAPYTVNVLANDSDPNQPALALSIASFTQPGHGTVSKNADNTLTYVPAANYTGTDTFTYTITNGTLTSTALVSVRVRALTTVSGTLTLENTSVQAQPIRFQFRPTDGGIASTFMVTPDSSGHFALNSVPAGTYNLAIKGYKWLQVVVPIDTASGNPTNIVATFIAGDANGDNRIDIGDFGVLINAYDSSSNQPGSGYDIRADFNDDGRVDIADFGILVNNYDLQGDP